MVLRLDPLGTEQPAARSSPRKPEPSPSPQKGRFQTKILENLSLSLYIYIHITCCHITWIYIYMYLNLQYLRQAIRCVVQPSNLKPQSHSPLQSGLAWRRQALYQRPRNEARVVAESYIGPLEGLLTSKNYYTILCFTILHYITLYYTVYYTPLYDTILYHTVLY